MINCRFISLWVRFHKLIVNIQFILIVIWTSLNDLNDLSNFFMLLNHLQALLLKSFLLQTAILLLRDLVSFEL